MKQNNTNSISATIRPDVFWPDTLDHQPDQGEGIGAWTSFRRIWRDFPEQFVVRDGSQENSENKYTWTLCRSFKLRMILMLGITILCVLGCVFILTGPMALVYASIPVIAAAGLFGYRLGLLMGLLIPPCYLLLGVAYGEAGWDLMSDPAGWIYYGILVLVGAIVGQIRDVNQRLNDRLIHAQPIESALRIQQMRLRALVAQMSLEEEKERRQIAMDILYRLDKTVSFANNSIAALEKYTTGAQPILQRTRQVINQSFQDIQNQVFYLSPPILYTAGLEAAVGWLSLRMRQRYGIPIRYDHNIGYKSFDENQKILLFQVIRELMLNACLHAEAREIIVILRQEGQELSIIVEDDGEGFDTSGLDARPYDDDGAGLFSIKERLSYFGGTISIVSRPELGTRVMVKLPLKKKQTPEK